MMVNAFVNLQDPILTAPKNPAMPADTLVGLQDLQKPIVTTSTIDSSPGADCHLVGYQPSSGKGASAGADRHYIGYYSSSRKGASTGADRLFISCHSFSRIGMFYHQATCIFLSLAILILYLLSGSEPLEVTFIRPCIHRLGHTRSG
jgi:hypothetical protein